MANSKSSFNHSILSLYAKEGYNVLLTGKHGVGKTVVVSSVFNELYGPVNEGWKYFSASTIDPWVDFIGIPKNYSREDGQEVIRIIPPESFVGTENIQALFFDEINRADEKTLNAIMELIQFRSINGRKFPNLKCIWAAENPADDNDNDYMVMRLDPAQRDRFDVQINVPYVLDREYLTSKYGETLFSIANSWWSTNENIKKKISPRRLDIIVGNFIKGFNIQDFTDTDVSELSSSLTGAMNFDKLKIAADSNDPDVIRGFFNVNTIRENKILFSNMDKKNTIFKKIYKYMSDEVKNYIEREFGYTHVNGNNKDEMSVEKNALISERSLDPKIPFDFGNVDTVVEEISKTVKAFQPQDFDQSSVMDAYDCFTLFPFNFDEGVYKDSKTKKDLADSICDKPENKAKFRDFYRICVLSIIIIAKEKGSNTIKTNPIWQFVDSIQKDPASNRVYSVSVTVGRRIMNAIEAGDFKEAYEVYNNNDLFFNK